MRLLRCGCLLKLIDWTSVSGLFIDAVDRPRLGNIAFVRAAVILIVVPPAFLLGMSFPITQKAIQDDPALVGQRVRADSGLQYSGEHGGKHPLRADPPPLFGHIRNGSARSPSVGFAVHSGTLTGGNKASS